MLGIDALFENPQVVRYMAKKMRLEAARIDVNPKDRSVLLSVRIGGAVKQVPLPTGKTLTIDQLLPLLFPASPPPP
jgi:hypothetical protein